jgi:hypothetical protein
VWDFVHDLGGPVGVANANTQSSDGDNGEKKKTRKLISLPKHSRKKKPCGVLMMGNSYLCQVLKLHLMRMVC